MKGKRFEIQDETESTLLNHRRTSEVKCTPHEFWKLLC